MKTNVDYTDLFVGDCPVVVVPHEVNFFVVLVEHVGTDLDELRLRPEFLNLLRIRHVEL